MNDDNNLQNEPWQNSQQYTQTQVFDKPAANPVLCFVGAFIGSIPGCIVWLILGRVGFIAGIAGYLIMLGAMKGNELLGGEATKGSLILCAVITVIMIFAANCLDYAISFYSMAVEEGLDISFGIVLRLLPDIITDSEIIGGFALNLVIGYILTALSCRKVFM